MSLLNIIGPVMVGPSSSHTAGAVRLGLLARQSWCGPITRADIFLRGSFAATYWGHGTDKGLVAGLLGLQPDDPRVRNAFELAEEAGMTVNFFTEEGAGGHPNTARMVLTDGTDTMEVVGCSIGGGLVRLLSINGFDVTLDGSATALVVTHKDQPGIVSALSSNLAREGINIASMSLSRKFKGQQAVAVLTLDGTITETQRQTLERACPEGSRVLVIEPLAEA